MGPIVLCVVFCGDGAQLRSDDLWVVDRWIRIKLLRSGPRRHAPATRRAAVRRRRSRQCTADGNHTRIAEGPLFPHWW